MSRDIKSVVIVRFDERGEQTYHVAGDSVAFFIVDERAPNDRVYEWLPRDSKADISAIIGDSAIGSSQDARHEAVKNSVMAIIEGRKRFRVVDGGAT